MSRGKENEHTVSNNTHVTDVSRAVHEGPDLLDGEAVVRRDMLARVVPEVINAQRTHGSEKKEAAAAAATLSR